MAVRKYLGQGEKFPPEVDRFGKITLINDLELVKQSVFKLFDEPIGTELYREHYGHQIRRVLFEPNDSICKSLLDFYIVDVINKWEQRIQLIDIVYTQPADNSAVINATIFFIVKQSSEINSFIYPFYRTLKN